VEVLYRSDKNKSNIKNLQITLSDTHKKFLVLYTNADSLHNRINEVKLIVSSFQYKPSLIAIMEVNKLIKINGKPTSVNWL